MTKIRKKIYQTIDCVKDDTYLSKIYNSFMVVVIILSIIPLCFKTQTNLLKTLDIITVVIFILDYVIRWITCDMKFPKFKKKAFIVYPFSIFAMIDLLSILPSIIIINPSFRLFKIFRLFRTFRVLKILRFSKSFTIVVNVFKREKQALLSVCIIAISYIFVSALIMFSVEAETFQTFFDALYWATTALTTVGYGDIFPVTSIGKVVSMVSSLLGIAFVALPAGVITAGYLSEIK